MNIGEFLASAWMWRLGWQLKRMAEQLGWQKASLSSYARRSRYERQSR